MGLLIVASSVTFIKSVNQSSIKPCLFEIVLSRYQFIVVSAKHGHTIVHKGPESEKHIILLMHHGQYDVFTKLPGFFNSCYFCLECEKAHSTEDFSHHKCKQTKRRSCCKRLSIHTTKFLKMKTSLKYPVKIVGGDSLESHGKSIINLSTLQNF